MAAILEISQRREAQTQFVKLLCDEVAENKRMCMCERKRERGKERERIVARGVTQFQHSRSSLTLAIENQILSVADIDFPWHTGSATRREKPGCEQHLLGSRAIPAIFFSRHPVRLGQWRYIWPEDDEILSLAFGPVLLVPRFVLRDVPLLISGRESPTTKLPKVNFDASLHSLLPVPQDAILVSLRIAFREGGTDRRTVVSPPLNTFVRRN